jgi:hypothetical protein
VGDFSFNTTVSGASGALVDCYFNQIDILPPQDDDLNGRKGLEAVAPLLATNPNASVDEATTCSSAFSVVYQRGDAHFAPGKAVNFNATSNLNLV